MKPSQKVTFAATGDSLITRHLPAQEDAARVAAVINQADVRFTNLEVLLRRNHEGFPSAQSGGTWITAPPEVLTDLCAYGFNLVAWANNHTLDYSYGGLAATEEALNRAGLVHAGAGANLIEASAARYLECPQARVALLAATASFHESWPAGNPLGNIPGRPGINPLRVSRVHRVSPQRLAELRSIAKATAINDTRDLSIREGFTPADKEGVFRFGEHLFRATAENEEEGIDTAPHAGDLQRMIEGIREAKRQADSVIVSIHAHEMRDNHKDLPAAFLTHFAHACIDAGASAIIGHGPHILRGVEIYKLRPIFYSLGNFIFQNETVAAVPADFYEKYGYATSIAMTESFDIRSQNGKRGLAANPKAWSSVIAKWTIEDDKLADLTLHPISLGFGLPRYRAGWPILSDDLALLENIAKLSREYGTEFTITKAGTAVWKNPKP